MNMQPINGILITNIKNRQTELGYLLHDAHAQIQYKQDAYGERASYANTTTLTRAQFNQLFPVPPAYTALIPSIAARKVEAEALRLQTVAWQALYDAVDKASAVAVQAFFTASGKSPVNATNQTYQNILNTVHNDEKQFIPWLQGTDVTKLFSDEGFATIYPKPTRASYTAENTIINTSITEANALNNYLKSGVNGLHDSDLLTGTQVTYNG